MSDDKFNSPFAALKKLRDAMPETPAKPVEAKAAEDKPKVPPMFSGKVVVRKEKKGRGGKTVTCVEGIKASPQVLETLAKDLKKALGCGATVETGMIVLQGELGPRVKALLEAKGAPHVILGN